MDECITSDDDDEAHNRVLHSCFEKANRTLKGRGRKYCIGKALDFAVRLFCQATNYLPGIKTRPTGFSQQLAGGWIQ